MLSDIRRNPLFFLLVILCTTNLNCRKKKSLLLIAAELREEVEEYMKGFDEQEEIERIQRNKRSREPDEDGFVVVKQRYE